MRKRSIHEAYDDRLPPDRYDAYDFDYPTPHSGPQMPAYPHEQHGRDAYDQSFHPYSDTWPPRAHPAAPRPAASAEYEPTPPHAAHPAYYAAGPAHTPGPGPAPGTAPPSAGMRPASTAPDPFVPGQTARKQNSACDACRRRKVRCCRTPGDAKCSLCTARRIPCTYVVSSLPRAGALSSSHLHSSHYVSQTNISRRTHSKRPKPTRSCSTSRGPEPDPLSSAGVARDTSSPSGKPAALPSASPSPLPVGIGQSPACPRGGVRLSSSSHPPTPTTFASAQGEENERRFGHLIEYLFDIPPTTVTNTDDDHGAEQWSPAPRPTSQAPEASGAPILPTIGPEVTAAVPLLLHLPRLSPGLATLLSSSRVKRDLADAAIDSFFTNVHPHWPLFSRSELEHIFRTSSEGCADALMAIVLLWGARFSDAPLLDSDRKECAAFLRSKYTRLKDRGEEPTPVQADLFRLRRAGASRIVHWLHARTVALFDMRRALIVATPEHAAACLLMHIYTPQWRARASQNLVVPRDKLILHAGDGEGIAAERTAASRALVTAHVEGYTRTYLLAAVEHLRSLGVHQADVADRLPTGPHVTAVLCWWHCLLVDTVDGLMFRTSPAIRREEYTVEPPPLPGLVWTDLASAPSPAPVPTDLPAMARWGTWVAAMLDLAELRRTLYATIWSPRAMKEGVAISALEAAVAAVHGWKAAHLAAVGVPPAWPSSWDLATVFQACFIEVVYAATWIALSCVVNEHGIAFPTGAMPPAAPGEKDRRADELRALIRRAAIELAGRIAMVAQTMAAQRYLQVDPGLMRAGFFHAGARLVGGGRNTEVRGIITALTQCADAAHDTDHFAVRLNQLMHAYAEMEERERANPNLSMPDTDDTDGGPGPPSAADADEHDEDDENEREHEQEPAESDPDRESDHELEVERETEQDCMSGLENEKEDASEEEQEGAREVIVHSPEKVQEQAQAHDPEPNSEPDSHPNEHYSKNDPEGKEPRFPVSDSAAEKRSHRKPEPDQKQLASESEHDPGGLGASPEPAAEPETRPEARLQPRLEAEDEGSGPPQQAPSMLSRMPAPQAKGAAADPLAGSAPPSPMLNSPPKDKSRGFALYRQAPRLASSAGCGTASASPR